MRNLAHEESARMQKMEQRLSQWELSMPRSVAQSTLLTNRQRSALSGIEHAAIRQPGRSTPDDPRLKSESMRNPCSNRPEAERHTIADNSSARKKAKQIICPTKCPPSLFPSKRHPAQFRARHECLSQVFRTRMSNAFRSDTALVHQGKRCSTGDNAPCHSHLMTDAVLCRLR